MIGLTLAALLTLGGWMAAQTRDEHGLPRRSLVSLGQGMAALGLLLGVLAVPLTLPPTTYAAALAGVLSLGLVLVRGAGRLSIGWTSVAEIVTSAVTLGWRRPARALWSLLAHAGGLSLAAWLAGQGEPAAGLLGALLVLAPTRWWLPQGARREKARTGVERAMAGALSGGVEWDGSEAAQRGAPVQLRFKGDATPVQVSAPLPPGWKSTNEEALSNEINSRLSAWGDPWVAYVDHSRRRFVASLGEPLPNLLRFDGCAARGHKVTLGLARVSPQARTAGIGETGALNPFVWDLDDTPAGIIVGTAGGGKSVLVRLIVTSLAMADWQVYLLDPKKVEMTPFRGRKNIIRVEDSLEGMARLSTYLSEEVDRRYAVLKREGVQKNSELKAPFPPVIIVVDEYYELVAKTPGFDEDVKAENDLRASIASAIRHIAAFARAADVHVVLLAQRADAEVVKGSLQNNLRFRALMRPATAGATARNMIGMSEVQPSGNPRGRAVMMTDSWPESEVQVAFLDAADLDRYLPRSAAQSEPTDGPVEPMEAAEGEAAAENNREPKSSAKPNEDRDDNRSDSDKRSDPESSSSPDKDQDDGQADSEHGPQPDLGIDPLDFWNED